MLIKKITAASILSLGVMLPIAAFSEVPPPPPAPAPFERPSINVTGDAEIKVTPDEALLVMSVTARDKDLLIGQKKMDTAMASALAHFKKLGVKPENLQTDYIDISPVFDDCNYPDGYKQGCDTTQVKHYHFRKGLNVKITDLTKFEQALTGALQSGVTSVESVQFSTTELRKHRDAARDMAVKAAKEKADAAAAVLGQKVGKPITVSLNNNWIYHSYYNSPRNMGFNVQAQNMKSMEDSSTGQGASISPGQIKVEAQADITFALE